jgi:hypothetical protein
MLGRNNYYNYDRRLEANGGAVSKEARKKKTKKLVLEG